MKIVPAIYPRRLWGAQVAMDHGFNPGLKVLRVFDRQSAGGVKLLPLVGRKLPPRRAQILLKLSEVRCR